MAEMIHWESFAMGAVTMINALGIWIAFFGTGRFISKTRDEGADRG